MTFEGRRAVVYRAPMDVTYRRATNADADRIALLHAESWRRAYRGMYSDAYLDGDLIGDRLAVWSERVADGNTRRMLLLAEVDDAAVGFVCLYGAEDATWGSLIDNLHVALARQRRGLGRALMRQAGEWLRDHYPSMAVHLWALEGNTNARRFYESVDGRNEGVEPHETPDGAVINACRYVWDSPDALVAACRE